MELSKEEVWVLARGLAEDAHRRLDSARAWLHGRDASGNAPEATEHLEAARALIDRTLELTRKP